MFLAGQCRASQLCQQSTVIYVTDLARSEAFYRDHLGFEKIEDMPPGILMKAGTVSLYLEANRERGNDATPRSSEFSPCFATESVKGSYGALKAAGVTISADYQEFAPTFAFFVIGDPDGNLIEFAGAP